MNDNRLVSVEPLPKQGCEDEMKVFNDARARLSGTPAEAGVRDFLKRRTALIQARLSGTPAEAGVRGRDVVCQADRRRVSVEPLPKQGCESEKSETAPPLLDTSQWNPCRSRGASPPLESFDITGGIGILIHPPTNRFTFCDFKEHLLDFTSN